MAVDGVCGHKIICYIEYYKYRVLFLKKFYIESHWIQDEDHIPHSLSVSQHFQLQFKPGQGN